jgi:hemolysin III
VAVIAGTILVLLASSPRTRMAVSIYSVSLAAMFGASALYHLHHWGPRVDAWLRRLDHAAIFIFIAGSYTPFCLVALRSQSGDMLLTMVWIVAGLGIVRALLWVDAPPWIAGAIYVAQGWMMLPYLPRLAVTVDPLGIGLLIAGGICYTVGAVVAGLERPDPVPAVFGYHEVFHALVIAGCVFQFGAVSRLVIANG